MSAQLLPRDAVVLVACMVGALIAFRTGTDVQLRASWVVPIDVSRYSNGAYANELEQLPPPLVVDLDGDGQAEVVVATPDGRLVAYDTRGVGAADAFAQGAAAPGADGWRSLPVLAEAALRGSVALASGRRPVAMSSGRLDPSSPSPSIAVLTDGWSVLLFNASLQLQWTSVVAHAALDDRLCHREAALTVAPWSLEPGARGVVLVSGRLAPRAADAEAGVDGLRAREAAREAAEGSPGAPWVSDAGHSGADAGWLQLHYFALEGASGTVHWSQVVGDAHDALAAADARGAPLEFRLDPHSLGGTRGGGGGGGGGKRAPQAGATAERDWRLFKRSVVRALLPELRWRRRSDTQLVLAHFEKERRRTARPSSDDAARRAAERAAGAHAFAPWSTWLPFGRAGARAADEGGGGGGGGGADGSLGADDTSAAQRAADLAYAATPNVLVGRGAEGLDVLHLYTGRVLARVPLVGAPGGGRDGEGGGVHHRVHTDVNGDTVLDHVYAVGTEVGEDAAAAALGLAPPAAASAPDADADADADDAAVNASSSARALLAASAQAEGTGACVGVATSGMPTRRALWQAGLCARTSRMRINSAARTAQPGRPRIPASSDLASRARSSAQVAVVAPLTLPSAARGPAERARTRDTVFLASSGRVTSVSATGKTNWFRSTGAWWAAGELSAHVAGPEAEALFPSIERLTLSTPASLAAEAGAPMFGGGADAAERLSEHYLLATGARNLVVLSAAGEPLASAALPCVPTGPPLVADFSADGVPDVVLPLRRMVVGYEVVRSAGSLALKALFGTLVAVVAVLFLRLQADAPALSRAGAPKRSTD